MAVAMANQGGVGIIHRYNSIEEQVLQVQSTNVVAGAAIGVSGDYLERASALLNAGVNILCVDIAHGHHVLMRHALTTLRNTFGYDVHIMAGNVATTAAVDEMDEWG